MKEFKVNEYITLKLEESKTNIYVKEQLFNQCKFLLLYIPIEAISTFDEIQSIDEAAEKLNRKIDQKIQIPSEIEFWGHCSNLQVWAENFYNSRLLHRNLAFPLLKKLAEIGDPLAKKVFKDEIAKRIRSNSQNIIFYFAENGYFNYLNKEELEFIFEDNDLKIIDSLLIQLRSNNYGIRETAFRLFKKLINYFPNDTKNKFIDLFIEEAEQSFLKESADYYHPYIALLMIGDKAYKHLGNLIKEWFFYYDHDEEGFFTQEAAIFFGYINNFLIFMRSRENNKKILTQYEFDLLYGFIKELGEVLDPLIILNNLSINIIENITIFLINELKNETNPQNYLNTLEFIRDYLFRLRRVNKESLFMNLVDLFITFKRKHKEYQFEGIFTELIIMLYEDKSIKGLINTKLFFKNMTIKLFSIDPLLYKSLIWKFSDPDLEEDHPLRKVFNDSLMFLLKSKDKDLIYYLLEQDFLLILEPIDLKYSLSKLEDEDLSYFLYGLDKLEKQDYNWHFDELSDVEQLLFDLKDTISQKEENDFLHQMKHIINLVITDYPSLFQYLMKNDYHKEISRKELKKILISSDFGTFKNIFYIIDKNFHLKADKLKYFREIKNNFSNNKKLENEFFDFFLNLLEF